MKVYLIDAENVKAKGLEGIENLSSKDEVILFWNERTGNRVRENYLFRMSTSKANSKIITINESSKNAMDFCICSYIGYLCAAYTKDDEFFIVSHDLGYTPAIDMMISFGYNVKRVADVEEKDDCYKEKEFVNEVLKDYPKKVRREAVFALHNAGNKNICNMMLQKALPKDGENVYRLIRTYFDKGEQ